MSETKHYCTGCGAEAERKCIECGEWRCARHAVTDTSFLGAWCSSTDGLQPRGAWCAKNHGYDKHQCGIVNHVHEGPVRQIRLINRDGIPMPQTAWFCRAWVTNNGGGPWRWNEEPAEPPKSTLQPFPQTYRELLDEMVAESLEAARCEEEQQRALATWVNETMKQQQQAHPCIANSCNGLHRGEVRNLSFRLEPQGPWTDRRWVCENAVATLRGIYPKLEWRDYEPDKNPKTLPPDHFPVPPSNRDCEPSPLTAARLEQMVQRVTDPKWSASEPLFCCWECDKKLAANEAFAVTLPAGGGTVYYCAKDYAARPGSGAVVPDRQPINGPEMTEWMEKHRGWPESIAPLLGGAFAGGIGRDLARKMRVDPPPDNPHTLAWKRKCDKCGVTSDGGRGKVVVGRWRGRCRLPDDWSRPTAFCERCLGALMDSIIGFEWNIPVPGSAPAEWGFGQTAILGVASKNEGSIDDAPRPLGECCTACDSIATTFCSRCDKARCAMHVSSAGNVCCTTEGGHGPAVCGPTKQVEPKCDYRCDRGFGGCKGKVQQGRRWLNDIGWAGPSWACDAAVARIRGVGGKWVPEAEWPPASSSASQSASELAPNPDEPASNAASFVCVDCGRKTFGHRQLQGDGKIRCARCNARYTVNLKLEHDNTRKLTTEQPSPLIPRTEADLPPRESAPAKRGIETDVLRQTYCENAPPREIVELTEVVLDGDECGGVPKTPHLRSRLHWDLHMKYEWERHEAWAKPRREAFEEAGKRGDGNAMVELETAAVDFRRPMPKDTDAFGGVVAGAEHGARCKLCGGWIRVRRERAHG